MLNLLDQNVNNKDLILEEKDKKVDDSNSDELKTKFKNFKCSYEGCQSVFNKKIRLQAHIRVNHTGYVIFIL